MKKIAKALLAIDHAVYQHESRPAEAFLRELILALPWGQHGAYFVTDRKVGGDYLRRVKTLWVNGRRRAWVLYDGGKRPWLDALSAKEAEKEYQERKLARRAQHLSYRHERDRLVCDMIAYQHFMFTSFGKWTYQEGQKGGCFFRRSWRDAVAAESAVREAQGPHVSGEGEESLWDQRLFGAKY